MTSMLQNQVVPADVITPQQRLIVSRKKLMSFMARGEDSVEQLDRHDKADSASTTSGSPKNALLRNLSRTLATWWRHHPAKLALEIAEPVVQQYARHKPYQLLGVAAAIGVASVVIRPWRMVSFTGLLLASIKSSGMANMALSILSTRTSPRKQNIPTTYQ